jgi:SAM-dependent methyltransferase
MSKYKYVNENAQVFWGNLAKQFLDKHSDEKYLSENGIISVDETRWREAQRYESSEWLQRAAGMTDDRNYFHEETFEGYKALEGKPLESVIELGCGPFTNIRLIEKVLPTLKDITLLDPLASTYITSQPNCTYKDHKVNEKNVKVVTSSIEDFEVNDKYDLVVMINVLEHCFSMPKIFDKINSMMEPGGYFVYADVQFDYDTIVKISRSKYNSGHPLRATKEYINNILTNNFEAVFSTTFEEEVAGEHAEELYFVGFKK